MNKYISSIYLDESFSEHSNISHSVTRLASLLISESNTFRATPRLFNEWRAVHSSE